MTQTATESDIEHDAVYSHIIKILHAAGNAQKRKKYTERSNDFTSAYF